MSVKLNRHIVLGMAGHIDHGKTAIVHALTGTNPDRLKEEQERGMTTDLGFAFLGKDITIIDVPGHEKFVKTMVAGVNTVDMAMLVIAADDGVMPQTKEHLEIINLLNVKKGLVALNKVDIADPEWVELVKEDIANLLIGTVLEGCPIVPVSAIDKINIDKLNDTIYDIASKIGDRFDKGVFRLPIDRIFSIKGFGTVVAGTVLSGKVAADDIVELLPQGKELRVRGIQTHDEKITESSVGYRTALNLGKIEKDAIERGDVLVEPGYFNATHMFDARFTLLSSSDKKLKHRARVRIHVGTSEVIGRIVLLDRDELIPGETCFVQFHLEKPIVADREDRYVIRRYSPIRTIGGGIVLDGDPRKHKRNQQNVIKQLNLLYEGDPNLVVLEFFNRNRFMPILATDICKGLGLTPAECDKRIGFLKENNSVLPIGKKRLMSNINYQLLSKKVHSQLKKYHENNPLKYAVAAAKLKTLIKGTVDQNVYDTILKKYCAENIIVMDGDQVRLATFSIALTTKQEELRDIVINRFLKNPFEPPFLTEIFNEMGDKIKVINNFLLESGEILLVEKGIWFHTNTITDVKKRIVELLLKKVDGINLQDARIVLEGMSRKRVVALLEYFDRTGVTYRDGNVRKLKK